MRFLRLPLFSSCVNHHFPIISRVHRCSEGGLTGEMQVTDAELGAGHMNREIDLRATTEVLDITITAVLRSARDCNDSYQ